MKHGSIFFALNSEGGKAPERIQLLPAGTRIIGRDGRWWNNSTPNDLIARTSARGVDLSIDENHITDRDWSGAPAPAMAWLSDLTVEADGSIWAKAAWTDDGRAKVESKAYRYLSPVFTFDESTKEIGALIGAALTNRPNLDLAALNNESQAQEESMKKIAAALGLPEDSTEDQVLVAVNAMKTKALNSQQVDLSVYAPRADVTAMEQRAINAETKLAEQAKADLKKRAEVAVDAAISARKIAPASKDDYLAMCASEEGLATFGKIMAKAPEVLPEAGGDHTSKPKEEVSLNAEDLAFAKSTGYTPEEWKKLKEGSK
jgi:phage I-like protein